MAALTRAELCFGSISITSCGRESSSQAIVAVMAPNTFQQGQGAQDGYPALARWLGLVPNKSRISREEWHCKELECSPCPWFRPLSRICSCRTASTSFTATRHFTPTWHPTRGSYSAQSGDSASFGDRSSWSDNDQNIRWGAQDFFRAAFCHRHERLFGCFPADLPCNALNDVRRTSIDRDVVISRPWVSFGLMNTVIDDLPSRHDETTEHGRAVHCPPAGY